VNISAGEPTLVQLKAEIDRRLNRELEQIAAQEAAAAAAQREQHSQKLESHLAGLRKEHELKQQGAAAKLNIDIQQGAQAAAWQAEKELLDQLEQAIQQKLGSSPCSQQQFNLWLADARARLDGGDELELIMNPAWSSALSVPEIAVVSSEMLGGARLVDKDSGRTLDGSWDLRLQDLWLEIVRYWQEHVLTHH
jgi:vacuolar-type H+-ATPase subunit E/Vma4